MDQLERLTVTQLRDAAEVLDENSVLAMQQPSGSCVLVRTGGGPLLAPEASSPGVSRVMALLWSWARRMLLNCQDDEAIYTSAE